MWYLRAYDETDEIAQEHRLLRFTPAELNGLGATVNPFGSTPLPSDVAVAIAIRYGAPVQDDADVEFFLEFETDLGDREAPPSASAPVAPERLG